MAEPGAGRKGYNPAEPALLSPSLIRTMLVYKTIARYQQELAQRRPELETHVLTDLHGSLFARNVRCFVDGDRLWFANETLVPFANTTIEWHKETGNNVYHANFDGFEEELSFSQLVERLGEAVQLVPAAA